MGFGQVRSQFGKRYRAMLLHHQKVFSVPMIGDPKADASAKLLTILVMVSPMAESNENIHAEPEENLAMIRP